MLGFVIDLFSDYSGRVYIVEYRCRRHYPKVCCDWWRK